MKKFKKLYILLTIMLISFSGIIFGCGDKYKNLKIETDLNSSFVELFLGDDLTQSQPTSITFNASVLGAGNDVSTNLKYNLSGNNLVKIELQKQSEASKTQIKLTALNLGETTLTLLTEEGGKSYSLNVKVTSPLKSIQLNSQSAYKPYAVVGQSTKLKATSILNFLPSNTTQRQVSFSLATPYSGVEVLEDGTINVSETAQNGTCLVNIASKDNPAISLSSPLQVTILKPIQDIVIKENNELLTTDVLQFSTNMEEENYKILNFSADPSENPFTINFELFDLNGNLSNDFSIQKINQNDSEKNTYIITALKVCTVNLKITASLDGYEYVSQPKFLQLNAIETPSVVEIKTSNNTNDLIVYDTYQNNLGEQITVNVGRVNAFDRRFVISIAPEDANKITILTGKRDSVGNLIPAKFYSINTENYDILSSGSVLYIKVNTGNFDLNNSTSIPVKFIAYGSMGLRGSEVFETLNLTLKRGVTELELENLTNNNSEVLVKVKQTDADEGTKIILKTNYNEYSQSIFTDFDDFGLLIQSNEVSYEDSVRQNDFRLYTFTFWGAKEGIYNLTFYAQNGKYCDVKIRVFTKVTDVTITTSTIEQNPDIAEINYNPDNILPTLNGESASLIVKNSSFINLYINTYNTVNDKKVLQNATLKGYPKYQYDDENSSKIITIDSTNTLRSLKIGQVNVTVTVFVYDDGLDLVDTQNYNVETNIKTFVLNFKVQVVELLRSISLNSNNVTIYEKASLSDFSDENGITDKEKYGEFEFDLKINPVSTILDENAITLHWSGDVSVINKPDSATFDGKSYKIKISCDQLTNLSSEAKVRLTITVVQYQRTLVEEAVINIKSAQKVTNIYNIKKEYNNASTLIPQTPNILPKTNQYGEIIGYEDDEVLYVYFDSRNMQSKTSFKLDAQIAPINALNKNLKYIVESYNEYPNVITIKNDEIVINNAGVTKLYLCPQDSYDASLGDVDEIKAYSNVVLIVIKVADGNTKYTALDISYASDLKSINNNVESLSKFYVVTKDIILNSESWTPIGYINGKVYPFTGNINGLISNLYGEKIIASISGLTYKDAVIDTDNNARYASLFAMLGSNALVENLNLSISSVSILQNADENVELLNLFVGGISAINNGSIENVIVNFVNSGNNYLTDVNITNGSNALYFGGVVAQNNGEIFNSFVDGSINILKSSRNTSYFIGGLVGQNNNLIDGHTYFFNQTELNDDYNSSINIIVNQQLDTNAQTAVGGLVGINHGKILNASFDGIVKVDNISHNTKNIGGIAGISYDELKNTFSSGKVLGNQNVGGLVGYALGTEQVHSKISNSSVNMLDDASLSPSIMGNVNVGGLIGAADYLELENTYARSYKKVDKENFEGDLLTNNDNNSQIYVGGVIGFATNSNLQKVYARISLNSYSEFVGGLIGYANNITLNNTYERNNLIGITSLKGLIIAQNGDDASTSNYFYGTNLDKNNNDISLCATEGKLNGSNNLQKSQTASISSLWSDVLTTKNDINDNEWTSANWYLPVGEQYPYLIFGSKQVLTVEAPTSITLNVIENDLISKIPADYNVDGTISSYMENTYVLFKNGTKMVLFKDLFDVEILPDDSILNVSKAYSLISSNEGILQVVGKTPGTYKLKLVSTGKVVLTAVSKLDADVKTEITLYVINVVKNFKLSQSKNIIVGTTQEIKSEMAANFANNNDFYIEFIKNDQNDQIYINDPQKVSLAQYWFKNNEKIFIGAKKSGEYQLYYNLFAKLDLLDLNGNPIYISLPNINNQNQKIIYEKNGKIYSGKLDYSFIYGIKSFACDTSNLETGLNDSAYIKYTLTGDDLRYNGIDLPKLKWDIDNKASCWDVQLSYAKIYTSETNSYIIYFTKNNNSTFDNDTNNIEYYDYDIEQCKNDTFIKIEFVFKVVVNESWAKIYFADNTLESILSNFTCTTNISNLNPTADDYNNIKDAVEAELSSQFIINRQKVDNISLDFYTNAEKTTDENNEEIYTINEMPSKAITSGIEGLLKIAIAPKNAEIKQVSISYQNSSNYNMSIRQMLYYEGIIEGKLTKGYVERKPYAVPNGKELNLYTESNYKEINDNLSLFNGYVYVACLIPSSVPSGQVFKISVNVIYSNNYQYAESVELVSKLPSQMSINYKFDEQTLDDFAYVAKGVANEFYVDFTELVEPSEINNLDSKFDPNSIFKVIVNEPNNLDNNSIYSYDYQIAFAKDKDDKIKIDLPSGSRRYYRVYYTLTMGKVDELTLQASITKIENNIQTVVISNAFKFKAVPYIIKNVYVIDGGNETLTISQSSPNKMQVNLNFEYDLSNVELNNLIEDQASTDGTIIKGKKSILEEKISKDLSYWFGIKQGSVDYETLDANSIYPNYNIVKNDNDYVTIGVKKINTTALMYVELPIDYGRDYADTNISFASKKIFENRIGLVQKTSGDNPTYIHYLRDDVTLNLSSDVSEESPIPVTNQKEFEEMTNGVDNNIVYYALDSDIVLTNYTPRNLENISLNGNMHTITIKSFNIVEEIDGETTKFNYSYGLFKNINENSVVKHLNVNYEGLVLNFDQIVDENISAKFQINNAIYRNLYKDDEITVSDKYRINASAFNLTSFNFGGVVVNNLGAIYNVSVTSTNPLTFINNVTISTQIGGFVANNSGYISYSQSNISFTSNCGYIGGFAAINSSKISNSKVIFNGTIQNTLTTITNALTGGFVARNSGEIFGSYVSAQNGLAYSYIAEDAVLSANTYVGGFVNQNTGTIKNSYSNITIKSETRSSGFVYNNSGTIVSSYSSCKIEDSNTAHSPFTGTDSNGAFINSGTIDDCYYIGEHSSYGKNELANQVSVSAASYKYQFAKFVFADDKSSYPEHINGIWRMDVVPKLVDADLDIYSSEKYQGVSTDDGNAYYNWIFIDDQNNDNPTFGQKSEKSDRINPRIIHNLKTWNDSINTGYKQSGYGTNNTTHDYFVVIKDIVADNLSSPNTSVIDFKGKLLGANMKISNLYLRADATNINKTYGLFKTLNEALVKDLSISVRQVVANNANCVGALSGYIEGSTICNIAIDATDVVVQGKNMVGAFAGIVSNSTITNIDVKGHINASYLSERTQIYNYVDSDFGILTDASEKTNDVPYSYAGVFAGAILKESTVKLVNVTGDNKVIAYHAGTLAGFIDMDAKLVLGKVKVATSQYINAYNIAGGLVAENRGTIDRCFVENIEQQPIDANISNTFINNRNLKFFINYPTFIGGLVGFNNGGTILNSYSKLDVRVEDNNYSTLASGGLVGLDVGGMIDSCYATGSVTNRYIIGGIIGVVTNKTTLLGYNNIGNEESISYRRNNRVFASNYNVSSNGELYQSGRGSYIAGKITELTGDSSLENKLLVTNTLASNKWIVNVDENYISSIKSAGMFIGEVVDAIGNSIIGNFSDSMLNNGEFKENNNNFINTQILKDNTISTADNVQINSMISAFIDNKFAEDVDNSIIYKLQNFSIGAITSDIEANYDSHTKSDINYNIAKCELSKALVSFENILNLDDLLISGTGGKTEYKNLTDEEKESGIFESNKNIYIKTESGTYLTTTNVYQEYNPSYISEILPSDINEQFSLDLSQKNIYYKENNTYKEIENDSNYLDEIIGISKDDFEKYRDAGTLYFKDNNGSYNKVNLDNEYGNNSNYYTIKPISSFEEFIDKLDDLYYFDDNVFKKVKDNNIQYFSKTDWDSVEASSTIYYVKINDNYLDLKILQEKCIINDHSYVGVQIDQNAFDALKLKGCLFVGGLDSIDMVEEDDYFRNTVRYFIKIEDPFDIEVYIVNDITYYTLNTFYVKNFDTLYIMPTFYIDSYGIYTYYSLRYFIIPDKSVSVTRLYPEIIENINID